MTRLHICQKDVQPNLSKKKELRARPLFPDYTLIHERSDLKYFSPSCNAATDQKERLKATISLLHSGGQYFYGAALWSMLPTKVGKQQGKLFGPFLLGKYILKIDVKQSKQVQSGPVSA